MSTRVPGHSSTGYMVPRYRYHGYIHTIAIDGTTVLSILIEPVLAIIDMHRYNLSIFPSVHLVGGAGLFIIKLFLESPRGASKRQL